MTDAPPLHDGETIVHDHIPSLRAFKRFALLMIVATLPVVAVFLYVFPDSIWPVVPLFVTCMILMQERVRLGRFRAWITDQRIVLQGGQDVDFTQVMGAKVRLNGVQVDTDGTAAGVKLFYPNDGAALATILSDAATTARKDPS